MWPRAVGTANENAMRTQSPRPIQRVRRTRPTWVRKAPSSVRSASRAHCPRWTKSTAYGIVHAMETMGARAAGPRSSPISAKVPLARNMIKATMTAATSAPMTMPPTLPLFFTSCPLSRLTRKSDISPYDRGGLFQHKQGVRPKMPPGPASFPGQYRPNLGPVAPVGTLSLKTRRTASEREPS